MQIHDTAVCMHNATLCTYSAEDCMYFVTNCPTCHGEMSLAVNPLTHVVAGTPENSYYINKGGIKVYASGWGFMHFPGLRLRCLPCPLVFALLALPAGLCAACRAACCFFSFFFLLVSFFLSSLTCLAFYPAQRTAGLARGVSLPYIARYRTLSAAVGCCRPLLPLLPLLPCCLPCCLKQS
jgi:hypothetical protein